MNGVSSAYRDRVHSYNSKKLKELYTEHKEYCAATAQLLKPMESEAVKFSKCAYSEKFKPECYFKKVDQRTIKACAREDALSRGKGVPIVSRHVSEKGTRRYYVTSWPHFVKYIYPRVTGIKKSFYENIYLDDLCRVFVDIDYALHPFMPAAGTEEATNAAFKKCHEKLSNIVTQFIYALKEWIETVYASENVLVTDVFVIDSSSTKKFSQHLIIHLDNDQTRFNSSMDLLNLFDYIGRTSLLQEIKEASASVSVSASAAVETPKDYNPFFWPPNIKADLLRIVSLLDSKKSTEQNDDNNNNNGDDHHMDVEEKENRPQQATDIYEKTNANNNGIVGSKEFITDMTVFGNTSRELRIVGSTKYGESRHLKLMTHLRFEDDCIIMKNRTTCCSIMDSYITDPDLFSQLLVCFIPENVHISKILSFDIVNNQKMKKIIEREEQKHFASMSPLNRENISRGASSSSSSQVRCHSSTRTSIVDKMVEEKFHTMADMKADYAQFPPEMKELFALFSDEAKREYVFEVIGNDIKRQNPHLEDETFGWTRFRTEDDFYSLSFGTSSKHCEIKGDEHSKNHVYYVVLLKSKCFYQRCWSPSCCDIVSNRTFGRYAKPGTLEQQGNDDGEDESYPLRELQSRVFDEVGNRSKSCKGESRYLSTDIWSMIQDYILMHKSMVNMYKKFKNGTLNDDMQTAAILNYDNKKNNTTTMTTTTTPVHDVEADSDIDLSLSFEEDDNDNVIKDTECMSRLSNLQFFYGGGDAKSFKLDPTIEDLF